MDLTKAEHLDLYDPFSSVSDVVFTDEGGQNSSILCDTGGAFGIDYPALWFFVSESIKTCCQQYVYAFGSRVYHADKVILQ